MANIFSYDVKVTCDEKDINKLTKYFDKETYCCDDFYYQKRDYGFVGSGTCKWSFISTFDDISKISEKYKATIEMYGNESDNEFCEHMLVENGNIIIQDEGWVYPIDIDMQDEYEDLDEYLEFLNKQVFGDDKDKYITYEELEESEFSDGCYIYQFYRDLWGEEDSNEPITYLDWVFYLDDEDDGLEVEIT